MLSSAQLSLSGAGQLLELERAGPSLPGGQQPSSAALADVWAWMGLRLRPFREALARLAF